jgi:hypothetical protein
MYLHVITGFTKRGVVFDENNILIIIKIKINGDGI